MSIALGLCFFIFKGLMGKAICNYVINYIRGLLFVHPFARNGCHMIAKVEMSARGNVDA